ncbi:MAG: ABC transporter permease [Candidatus Micrarchaeaceae archaeon]|jgi:ABC-2 type transport system permease protein|nr:ABC transporter permease [Candidatus Micrarchaeota archaeon]HII10330.1 ABC transporter permease [Candidatus Micrarchaeota archaeon]
MGRSKLSQLWASVLINAIYSMENYPITLVNTFMAPLSILIIITLVSHGTLLSVGLSGALIMTMVTSGIGLQADLSHLKNDFKVQDMVVSSPTSAFMYMLGMAVSEVIFSLPAIIILTILAVLFIKVTIIGAIVIFAVMALMFSFSIALGFFLSTYSTDIVQNYAFMGILSIFLTTIPPVYYPITYIPLPYRYIAYLSPTTYAAEIIQSAIGYLQLSTLTLAVDWAVVIAVAAVLLTLSIKKSRWRES